MQRHKLSSAHVEANFRDYDLLLASMKKHGFDSAFPIVILKAKFWMGFIAGKQRNNLVSSQLQWSLRDLRRTPRIMPFELIRRVQVAVKNNRVGPG